MEKSLLDLVKATLRITWPEDDPFLREIIGRGKAYINNLVGRELDYTSYGLAQSLFLNYCRYDYNNALEYFEENFHKEILRLQLEVGTRENPKTDQEVDV